jgi:drug/metabolite transporter (DMT)-like permease
LREAWPSPGRALALVAIGAIGYGASLALYLLSQRVLGAARAATLFAAGPFVGALLAFALGDRPSTAWLPVGAALLVIGVALPMTERHGHRHRLV